MMEECCERVWELIVSLNKSWTTGKPKEELEKYFHDDVIALVSSDKKKISGRSSCASYWRSCFDNNIIFSWKEFAPDVRIYGNGNFAVVEYEFKLSIERDGNVEDISGRDLFSLICENGKWFIIAATI